MTILGIDPGTLLGWAVLDARGERVASGCVRLPRGPDNFGARVLEARRALRGLLVEHDPERIAVEYVRAHRGTQAAHVYGALLGVVTAEATARRLPCDRHEVAHVKQRATGAGNASKLAMREAARIRWGVEVGADEADALWVAACSVGWLGAAEEVA